MQSSIGKAGIAKESTTLFTTKKCAQEEVVSPLLKTMVVDELIDTLGNNGFEIQGYLDDLDAIHRGTF